jgi:hypothetical protein
MFGGSDTSKSGVGGNGAKFRWKSRSPSCGSQVAEKTHGRNN